jgi:hypothetical protein
MCLALLSFSPLWEENKRYLAHGKASGTVSTAETTSTIMDDNRGGNEW